MHRTTVSQPLRYALVAVAASWLVASAAACDAEGNCVRDPSAPAGVYACRQPGQPSADASTDAGTADAGERDALTPPRDYPAGPYGYEVGAVIRNLQFAATDGSQLRLGAFHGDESATVLLISTAAGWCAACIEEQPALVDLHVRFARHGLRIVVAVFEDEIGQPATLDYATDWQQQYGLPFDTVADSQNLTGAFYDTALAPMNMLVDLRTMRIERILIGFDVNAIEAILTSGR